MESAGPGRVNTRSKGLALGKCRVPEKVKGPDTGKWHKSKLEDQPRVKACKFLRRVDCVLSAKRSHQQAFSRVIGCNICYDHMCFPQCIYSIPH